MKLPFVSRRRAERDEEALRAAINRLRTERDQAVRDRNTWHTAATTTAGQYTDAGVVNDCLERRVKQLQAQLDDALGLNAPAVDAGSSWQERRELRMKYDKPTAAEEAS